MSLQNISFGYDRKKKILHDISLDIRNGDQVALLGKNGCGKSTLAKVLCGLLNENGGKIVFQGEKQPAKKRTQQISYVMQNVDFQLFGCSLYDDLLLGSENIPNVDMKIKEALAKLNLLNMIDDHPKIGRAHV